MESHKKSAHGPLLFLIYVNFKGENTSAKSYAFADIFRLLLNDVDRRRSFHNVIYVLLSTAASNVVSDWARGWSQTRGGYYLRVQKLRVVESH